MKAFMTCTGKEEKLNLISKLRFGKMNKLMGSSIAYSIYNLYN